jgi:5-methylcytosine-specific restriction enzyme B
LPSDPAGRYVRFVELVRQLDDDHVQVEHTAAWFEVRKPVFLDPVLVDRCSLGLAGDATDDELRANEAALGRIAQHIGNALADDVSAAVGRTLAAKRPPRTRESGVPRAGVWVDWVTKDHGGLGMRLEVTPTGAALGLRPGNVRPRWLEEARAIAADAGLDGFRIIGPTDYVLEQQGTAGPGDFSYSRWFDRDQLTELDLPAVATSTAVALQPVIDKLVQHATGEEPPEVDDPLLPLVEAFRTQGYPTPADEEHKADRERFESLLRPGSISLADPAELRQIWNTSRYGSLVRRPTQPLAARRRCSRVRPHPRRDHLPVLGRRRRRGADRRGPRRCRTHVSGLGEAVIMKLLAICHPDRYLPVYPTAGPRGSSTCSAARARPSPRAGRGASSRWKPTTLRRRLDRLFPGDPWGMAQFLYWYAEQPHEGEAAPDVDPLDELADELLVDRAFLDDIVALLEDKGQVILYGPPGTGKTYLARKLAEALVPDPTRRSLVQFHPSTSYEDFFEGYRPEAGVDGEMTYRLTPGPLALLAARAADAPGKRHMMIIDEINRANLPRRCSASCCSSSSTATNRSAPSTGPRTPSSCPTTCGSSAP